MISFHLDCKSQKQNIYKITSILRSARDHKTHQNAHHPWQRKAPSSRSQLCSTPQEADTLYPPAGLLCRAAGSTQQRETRRKTPRCSSLTIARFTYPSPCHLLRQTYIGRRRWGQFEMDEVSAAPVSKESDGF